MGRGRAKAKQTRIARDLKYSPPGTDLDRLRAELTGADDPGGTASADGVLTDEVLDDDLDVVDDLDDEEDEDDAR